MFNLIRRVGLIAAFALASASGTAQETSAPPERATVVYGGSSWLGSYPVWIGLKKDLFKKRGLDVRWQAFATSSGRMGSLVAGDLDFAQPGAISTLALMAADNKSFSIIAVPDSYVTVEGILAAESVQSIADLRGKKIGVPFATSAHMLVLDILNQAKLDPNKDVTLVNMPVTEMLGAIRSKQVDAVAAWTPAFHKVKALPGMKVLVDDREFSLYKKYNVPPGPDVIVVRNEFRDKYPRTSAAFVEGLFEAIAFLRDKPEEAAPLLMELTNLSPDEQKQVLADVHWNDRAAQQKLLLGDDRDWCQGNPPRCGPFVAGLDLLGKFLVDNKQLTRAPKVGGWFDSRFVRTSDASALKASSQPAPSTGVAKTKAAK